MRFVYVKDIKEALKSLKEHLMGNWNRDYFYGLLEMDGSVFADWYPFEPFVPNFLCFIKPEDEKALKCFLRSSLEDLVKEAIAKFVDRGYGIEIHPKNKLTSWLEQYLNKKGINLEDWANERELTGKDIVEILKPIERRIERYIKKHSKPENEVEAGDIVLMRKTGHCDGALVYDIYFFDKRYSKTLGKMVEEFTVRAGMDPHRCEHCKMPHSLIIGRWVIHRVSVGAIEQARELETSLTELLKRAHSC